MSRRRTEDAPKGNTGNGADSENANTVTAKKPTGRPKGRKSGYTLTQNALSQRKKAAEQRMIPVPETDEERSYNARLIDHIMQINEIALNADRSDLLSLRSCFIAYLKLCQRNGFCASNLSAYASMGFDKNSFDAFSKKDDPEIKAFCRWVRETCAMFREHMVADSKINPVIGIFWQRNYDGLRNDTEQVQSAQEQEENSNSSKYREKYKNLIGSGKDD